MILRLCTVDATSVFVHMCCIGVICGLVCLLERLEATQVNTAPSPVELFDKWERWHQRVSRIEPIALVMEVSGNEEASFGSEHTRYENYFSKGLFAGKIDRRLMQGVNSRNFIAHLVQIVRLDATPIEIVLTRVAPNTGYMVSEVHENVDVAGRPLAESYSRFCLIEMLPSEIGLLNDDIAVVVESSESTIILEKEYGNPTEDSAKKKLLKIRITFSKEQDWLPTEIIAKYQFNDGEAGTWKFRFTDWRVWEGEKIPFASQIKLLESVTKYPDNLSTKRILELRRCRRAEVAQRCTLGFYGLPEFPDTKQKRISGWLVAILGGLGVLAGICVFVQRRRSNAK